MPAVSNAVPETATVKGYLIKVALWLPIMFFCWYYMAVLCTLPLRLVLDALLPWVFPQAVEAVEQSGHLLDVVTAFAPPPGVALPSGQAAVLVFSVNPLIYAFGLPLYGALLLAAPGTENEKWRKALLGLLVLCPVQFWGVFIETLKILLFDLGPDISAKMAFTDLSFELVAWAYQFGYLILPAVSPIIAWLWLHRTFVADLAPAVSQTGPMRTGP